MRVAPGAPKHQKIAAEPPHVGLARQQSAQHLVDVQAEGGQSLDNTQPIAHIHVS